MFHLVNLSQQHTLETMNFSAGESFVKFQAFSKDLDIRWVYESDSELIQLAQIVDLARHQGVSNITLRLSYLPHARQDRYTTLFQPFSLKIFLTMLHDIFHEDPVRMGQNVNNYKIECWDIHSGVAEQIAKDIGLNLINKPSFNFAEDIIFCGMYDYVISPDNGALHKAAEWARVLEIPMFCCDKVRDSGTGHIVSYSVPNVGLDDTRVLVVDDICDGGRTFMTLSESLPKTCEADLFVTHGIFSKGVDELLKFYRRIITTNSLPYYKKYVDNSHFKVLSIPL